MKYLISRFELLVEAMKSGHSKAEIISATNILGNTAIRIRDARKGENERWDCLTNLYKTSKELVHLVSGDIHYIDVYKYGKKYLDMLNQNISKIAKKSGFEYKKVEI